MCKTIGPATRGQFCAGQSYPSKDATQTYTVLAVHGDEMLLEMKHAKSGELTQYCVAHQPSLHEGFLVWQQGSHHLANISYGNDPFLALCAAVDDMRRAKAIYVLINNTSRGATCSIHRTADDAAEALNKMLASDLGMKIIAKSLGIQLSAFNYLEHRDDFTEHGADGCYSIVEASYQ